MKFVIILILLIANTVFIFSRSNKRQAAAVGVIGRIDRKTVKFIFSHIDWILLFMIILDVAFIVYLFMTYLEKL
jgi:cbb3-type cytochrome oxidase subunit 3